MKTVKTGFKNVLYVLSLSALFLACENDVQEDVNLQENEFQRNAVYDQILNERELFMEFMDRMSQDNQSMDWIVSNESMMREIFSEEHMQTMIRENPQVMDHMMLEMMAAMQQDPAMMRQNPEMREQMMENMMNMMQQDTAMYNQMQQRMQQHHLDGVTGRN